MNLEIVGSVAGIKYLFKYINKGSDRVLVSTDDGKTAPNEVKNYVNGKYTSGSESLWRINGFPINWMYPSVEKLDLHLEGEQDVFLKTDTNLKEAAKKKSETQLTAWFKLNDRRNVDGTLSEDAQIANTLIYPNVLKYFTWNSGKKEWKKRKNRMSLDKDSDALSDTIGRLAFVPLNNHNPEKYFLRLLLHNVKGAKSYQDLMKDETGKQYKSFKAAAVARGMIILNFHKKYTLLILSNYRFVGRR